LILFTSEEIMINIRTPRRTMMASGILALALIALPGAAQRPPPPQQPPTGLKIPPQPPPAPVSPVLQNYTPVTAERLKKPADGDWLMIRRTYDGWGYSPLTQITSANVKKLEPVWLMSTGMNNGHQAPPIVNNGVMFVATSYNQVIAADAKTGALLWRYLSPSPPDARVGKPVSRGVALLDDKVFFALGEAVLVALDARTGKEVWRTKIDENKSGFYSTGVPLVADGKLLVGISGGDGPTRGFVAAYDVETGKELWKTYTIPAPGEPGGDTWKGDQWKTGGGSTWVTGNYDAETNLAYWGVGNGYPWVGYQRPGDNLYTASTIAIDAATGKIKGHFQYTPNESWDWDEVSPPLLIDFKRGNRTLKGLVNFTRSGYMYYLERADGAIHFIDGAPYVKQNVFEGIDAKTGRPTIDPAHKPDIDKVADFCPSWHGGKNWVPGAYSPKTRLIYIPTQENLCAVMVGRSIPSRDGGPNRVATTNQMYIAPGADHISEVQAWNVDTGKKAWAHNFAKSPNWGAMMATAGGLVFSGGTNDRMFRAFDATSGEVLWEFPTNSGVYAPASSFMLDGKQYIAVVSGWGQDARSMESRINGVSPGNFPEVPEGGVIWVFAVK
jgi:alcohol dehydrogenase (cytochrome c)